jgi:L-threonylcarbamoyladenylate synthase
MEIVSLSNTSIGEAAKKAARALRAGQIIVYPTDTVYGIGVDAHNVGAIQRLRILKQRETKKPITIIVPSIKSIEHYATIPDAAKPLIEKYFPGPLTLILPAKHAIRSEITLHEGIGIRYPKHEFSETLAHVFGKPFTSTSANRSGRENPKTIQEVLEQFRLDINEIDLVIDGGELSNAVPSTVVSFMFKKPLVLREGKITRAELGL